MAGEEVLIADASSKDRVGLVALCERHGLIPTTFDTAQRAREQIAGKFFAIALVDLDLPGGGVALLEFARERSAATQLVALTSRKNFDAAIAAFRLGAVDVVFKRPDEVARLEHALGAAIGRYQATSGQGAHDALELIDELTRTMVSLGRQVYAGEIESLTQVSRVDLEILYVDDDGAFLGELTTQLADAHVDAVVEMSGGGALDKIGEHRFDVVVVKESLGDLPGSIVVAGAQQRSADCVALAYTPPGPAGRIDRIEHGHVVASYAPFTSASDLAGRVKQLLDEEATRRRERRVLQVIGSKHGELLRKYGEVKRQLEGVQR